MTERELNICLREMARGVGLCDEWYGKWKDSDSLDKCLERYVRGFDFCEKHDWPPLDFVREHFDRELLHRHHIYLDEEVDIETRESGYWVFLGRCTGRIRFTGYAVATVFVRGESEVKVEKEGMAKVFF